jgi:hypothetical protein
MLKQILLLAGLLSITTSLPSVAHNSPSTSVATVHETKEVVETFKDTALPKSSASLPLDEFKEYFKISGENTASVGSHIDFLLLFIAFITIIASFGGFGVLKRNKELHEALMDLQKEMKENVTYSVDVAVAREMNARSEELFEYSQEKLGSLEVTMLKVLFSVEQISTSMMRLKPNGNLSSAKEGDRAGLKNALLKLLSDRDVEVDNSILILEAKLSSQEWVVMDEQLIEFLELVIKQSKVLSNSFLLKSRLKQLAIIHH